MSEYVKGAEPDRWHWMKECKQYPRVIIERRLKKLTSDLCDECLDIEKIKLRKIAAMSPGLSLRISFRVFSVANALNN